MFLDNQPEIYSNHESHRFQCKSHGLTATQANLTGIVHFALVTSANVVLNGCSRKGVACVAIQFSPQRLLSVPSEFMN